MAAPPIGNWTGPITDVPSGHLPHVPLAGNGYIGLAMGTLGPTNVFEKLTALFINTNANWECKPTGKPSPAAECSMRVLGGLTVAHNISNSTFYAEQRMINGSLFSVHRNATASLSTTTSVHPVENLFYVEVVYDGPAETMDIEVLNFADGANRHTPPQTVGECTLSATPACSRRLAPFGSGNDFHSMWTALAVAASGGVKPEYMERATRPDLAYVALTYRLQRGVPLRLVGAVVDNLNERSDFDPKARATSLAVGSRGEGITNASTAFWRAFWASATVELPTRPAVRDMWIGAQYALAISTPSQEVFERHQRRAPPPGLYGPFATGDFAFWNGDMTLDYNYQSTFYGVYSSNKPSQASAYFRPIVEWMDAARVEAQATAKQANVTCSTDALHYACHLAPWGYQSFDTSIYMNWNGPYAALLFINDWEYTRDAGFARNVTLPLLRGLNAFSHCYLRRNTSGGALVLDDWNPARPDQVAETIDARNPLPGLSLMRRVAAAEIDIGEALGVAAPAWLREIVDRLAPYANVSYPPARPRGSSPSSAAAAEGRIWVEAEGEAWEDAFNNWDRFSSVLFPLFPAEAVVGLAADDATKAIAQASAKFFSFQFNSTPPTNSTPPHADTAPWAGGVPAGWGALTLFAAAVRALPKDEGDEGRYALTAREILDGLDGYIAAYQGPNYLLYAPGGGVENAGMSHAVNDMLVQATDGAEGFIQLFPAWPPAEPASFTSLRTKGAFLVSAAWDATRREVDEPVTVVATVAARCRLAHPWPARHNGRISGTANGVRVVCGSRAFVEEPDGRGRVSWTMAPGERCEVRPVASAMP